MDVLFTSVADGVGEIVLDAPPRNVADPEIWLQIEQALEALRSDGNRVVVISSALEDCFVAHGSLADIIEFFDDDSPRVATGDIDAQNRVMRELDRGPMVSIAAVDGQAWGGGAELAWSCDLRVASAQASFAQPEVHLGLTPGWGGATKVARLAGESIALRLVLDGQPIDGVEAHRIGLVDRLAPPGHVRAVALDWAENLATRPPWALAGNKTLIKEIRELSTKQALRRELETFAAHCTRSEAMDLIRAAQARYDAGGDSYDAFGLPRPSPPTASGH